MLAKPKLTLENFMHDTHIAKQVENDEIAETSEFFTGIPFVQTAWRTLQSRANVSRVPLSFTFWKVAILDTPAFATEFRRNSPAPVGPFVGITIDVHREESY